MDIITILQSNMWFALGFFSLFGLCVGSFLNVVIHRKPMMMLADWRKAAIDILEQKTDVGAPIDEDTLSKVQAVIAQDTAITLSRPASRCPKCGHQIRWYENIPLISWLALRGKCRGCGTAISFRYPLIEVITAILSALVIYSFGVTGAGISALFFIWILIALTGIDFDTQYLPDDLTYPLAGLGLLASTQGWFTSPTLAILGLICGFMSLWLINKITLLLFKKHGIGGGDFKLLGALGAWLGITYLPLIVLLSSVLGTMVGILYYLKHGKSMPFAFGPYLAISGIIALFYGQDIITGYLAFAGLA